MPILPYTHKLKTSLEVMRLFFNCDDHLLFDRTPDSVTCSSPVWPTLIETCSPSPKKREISFLTSTSTITLRGWAREEEVSKFK